MSKLIHVGCCGLPVAQELYFRTFPIVEINSTFYNLPRLSTSAAWRSRAPDGFKFSVKAWQLITHPATSPTYRKLTLKLPERRKAFYGHFKDTREVLEAWAKTLEILHSLRASFVLFQTPASFYPQADHLRDMYRFFKKVRRSSFLLVWEPRGPGWTQNLIRRVCEDLNLLHASDPFQMLPQRGWMNYFRMHGGLKEKRVLYQHEYTEQELIRLRSWAQEKVSYVFFNNVSMWHDAQRFQEMIPVSGNDPSIRYRV